MKSLIFVTSLALTGCASNAGVVPTGPDSYLVSKQAATGFSGADTLKVDALKEANEYCLKKEKQVKVTHTSEAKPPYVMGNYPRAEVEFMCLNAGDPELTRPKLARDADTVIEVRK